MKILIVGYGSIGKRHVKNILEYSNHDIIICTKQKNIEFIDPKRCKIFNALDDCINENPDIGFVTNVTSEHIDAAIKLAKSGCHLFLEKPLSNSLAKTGHLSKIVNKKKLITLMGCNLRFHECICKIKELISKNAVGRIISARVEWGTYLPEWHPYEDYKNSYASRRDLGGGVVLTCIHEIDYLYWFFGIPSETIAMTGTYSNLDIPVDDLAAIILKFKNDIIAEVHLDFFQRPDFRSCKIIGTNGTIYWDSGINEVKIYDIKTRMWKIKFKLKKYERNKMYVKEIQHFFNCIKQKKKTINDLEQGIDTLKIVLNIIESSRKRKIIRT